MFSLVKKGIARIALCLTMLLSGLMVCIHIPQTTEILSRLTSDASKFQTSADSISKASLATRDFALGSIDAESLNTTLVNLGFPSGALDTSMLSHLQDCTPIFNIFTTIFIALLVVSIVFITITLIINGKKSLSKLLLHSSLLAILTLLVLSFWVISSFESFFTWMHSLFFKSGTWTFDANSLLICMFPENFWILNGVVWALTSLLVSIITIFISRHITKR